MLELRDIRGTNALHLLNAAGTEVGVLTNALGVYEATNGAGIISRIKGESHTKADPSGNAGGHAVLKVTVIKVESIEPDPMANLQEIDDGDGNPKTRVFVVPCSLEYMPEPVTVRAKISPSLAESELPPGYGLAGGTGAGLLTRYVDRAGVSKTVFTFWCGGGASDSGLKTTIYAYYASVGLFADGSIYENTLGVGHSWGEYNMDYVSKEELINSDYWNYFTKMGFYPTNTQVGSAMLGNIVPGDIRHGLNAYGSHQPTADQEYHIEIAINDLKGALAQVDDLHTYIPDYHIPTYNCTDFAIGLGEFVDIYTMDASGISTPWDFAAWLNANPP